MVIHSINIFDKKGKILFTKAYSPVAIKQERYLLESGTAEPGSDPVTEQKKLIFGMLFSLRELVGSLTPEHSRKSLQSIQTASATVHTYETLSGLRFALYTSNDVPTCKLSDPTAVSAASAGGTNYYSPTPTPGSSSTASTTSGNAMLTSSSSTPYTTTYNSNNHQSTSSLLESNTAIFGRDALVHIYSNIWVECVVRSPLYVGNSGGDALMECIKSTTFEKELDLYVSSLPWFQS